jgi:uncharacterized repeat protein (TIGR01451 family)
MKTSLQRRKYWGEVEWRIFPNIHHVIFGGTMKTCFRILILLSMILGLCATAQQPVIAQAKADESKPAMPAGLQEAFLAATLKPFSTQGGNYTTEYNGLSYKLNASGLQAVGNGIQWGISLRGMGRGNQADDVQAPEIVQTGERLEYRRGALTEWYRDTALGVEQGFTISEPTKGNGKLVLHLDLSTNVEGKLNDDERGLSFAGADGKTLRYDNLKAYDANHVELDAKMIYNPAQVVIQVDDRGAAYPITIDPMIYMEQKVIAIDGASSDFFGLSVAISGDTAIVGAHGDNVGANTDQGSAYVFVRNGNTWSQQAKLTASDGAANDNFGISVAISGDTALIGAHADVGANADQGSAYVFVRSGTIWTEQQKLTASDGAAVDQFGISVAISGDTALIGAYCDDVSVNADQGSAYVFTRSGTTWTQQTQLTASDGAATDWFGISVAISGDTALIGARWDDVGANAVQGSAYVFVRSGAIWTEQQKLTASDGATNDNFGGSVAISGDTALIGAFLDVVGANVDQGSAYVFVRSGTTWTEQQKLTALDGAATDRFGYSVSISGDTAVIGAYWDDVGANGNQGSAYVFTRNGTTWSQQTQLTASDGAAVDQFGFSAISGDTILVGAYYDDVGANGDQGAAYFYQTDTDLVVSVVSSASAPVFAGDTIQFTTTVMNHGISSANDVMLDISLPAGLTYVAHAATFGTFTPGTGVWDVGSLNSGIIATLTIQATVDAGVTAPSLTFSVQSLYHDMNSANDSASVSVTMGKFVVIKSPTTKNYGNVKVGLTSAGQVFTITNNGNVNLNVGTLSLSGTNPTSFGMSADTCSSTTVVPGAFCTVTITFAPLAGGNLSATLNIPSNAPTSPDTVTLSGRGMLEKAVNGGFNIYAGTSKIPTSWTASTNFSATDGKDTILANRKEGTASVKIANTTAVIKTLTQTLSPLSGAAGDPFIFSYWVKGSALPAAGLCQAQVLFYNGAALKGTKTLACGLTGTFAYKQKTLSFTAPTSYTSVKIVFTFSKATGTVWFDAVSLLR